MFVELIKIAINLIACSNKNFYFDFKLQITGQKFKYLLKSEIVEKYCFILDNLERSVLLSIPV